MVESNYNKSVEFILNSHSLTVEEKLKLWLDNFNGCKASEYHTGTAGVGTEVINISELMRICGGEWLKAANRVAAERERARKFPEVFTQTGG